MPDPLAALGAMLASPEWRLANLYQIVDEHGRHVPFVERAEQSKFRQNRGLRNYIPKARQLGMSTWIVLANLDFALFRANSAVGLVDKTQKNAWEKLEKAKFAWGQGPAHPNPSIAAIWRKIHEANPLVQDTNSVMAWHNGSSFTADVSFTGSTLQRLHVSELGPIAAKSIVKAGEIRRGSMKAVHATGIIDVETTMEGGRFGHNYDLFKLALENQGRDAGPLDWKLHFMPWHGHPNYRLPGRVPVRPQTLEYFRELRKTHGLDISLDSQAWWEAQHLEMKDEIWQQFPSTVEECDRTTVAGAIFPQMITARAERRVCAYAAEPGAPLVASFDLGAGDNMAGWLSQTAGKAINLLDFCAGEGKGAPGMADLIRLWEREHGPVALVLLPHDAEVTDKGSGKTYVAQLVEAGIPRHIIRIVPRTPAVWVGIGEVRKRMGNMWFHARCDQVIKDATGTDLPGGVGRLEGYRKQPQTSSGNLKDVPVPDVCSHAADALRTLCEGMERGLLASMTAGRPPEKPHVKKAGEWV